MADPGAGGVGGLVVVRHGATSWSESGRHTSTTDLELLASGRSDAAALAPLVGSLEITGAYTSPRRRARGTFELLSLDLAPIVLEDLAEWDYGTYEGRTSEEIHAEHPTWDLFRDGCPNGEGPAQVGARVDRVLAMLAIAPGAPGLALLVAHGHILRVLAARYLGFEVAAARHFVLEAGHVCILGHEHADRALVAWNLSARR